MSLLIKGLELPKGDSGFFCRLWAYKDGTATFTQYGRTPFDQPDNHYFPAVEVQSSHGRLIDEHKALRALIKAFPKRGMDFYIKLEETLDSVQTIIEAEE